MHPLLQPLPHVLDRIHVWRVGGQCHDLNVVLLEPRHGILRSMRLCVILLKDRIAERIVKAILKDSDIHPSID